MIILIGHNYYWISHISSNIIKAGISYLLVIILIPQYLPMIIIIHIIIIWSSYVFPCFPMVSHHFSLEMFGRVPPQGDSDGEAGHRGGVVGWRAHSELEKKPKINGGLVEVIIDWWMTNGGFKRWEKWLYMVINGGFKRWENHLFRLGPSIPWRTVSHNQRVYHGDFTKSSAL